MNYPIFTGTHGNCHIQGIAVDQKKGYIYYSFTTKLIKSTLDGQIVGSVEGLTGHLGCIDFNEADGRVYGSLEYERLAGMCFHKFLHKREESFLHHSHIWIRECIEEKGINFCGTQYICEI